MGVGWVAYFVVLASVALLVSMNVESFASPYPYQTQTFSPTGVIRSVAGGPEVNFGLSLTNIGSQNCGFGTCTNSNSWNYGFSSSGTTQTFIRMIYSYDLSSAGISGSQIKNMTFTFAGCWHGSTGRTCDNTGNPGFDSNGGKAIFMIWNGTTWLQLGSQLNLGTSSDSTADSYNTYTFTKNSGFSNGYLQNGILRIAIQTSGTTQNSQAVQQVVDSVILKAKYYVPPSDTRPNILVIMTDDQRWDTIKYMANVTKLAGQGITFTNDFVNTPLCCPARSSFLTGEYAHNHHVWTNAQPHGGATLFNDTSTMAVWLQNAGYTTGLIGKYLNDYQKIKTHVPPGWNEWHALVPPAYYLYSANDNGAVSGPYTVSPANYSTTLEKGKVLNFIQTANRPFFLWWTPNAPHIDGSQYATPAPGDISTLWCPKDTFRPPSFNEADVSDKPRWVQNLPNMTTTSLLNMSGVTGTQYVTKLRITQICALKGVDDAVGNILSELGPELNNTLVIFASDNGYTWGEHRWYYKSCEFDECIRVPLIMRYPSLISPGQVNNQLLQQVDLVPTILQIANATPKLPQNGKSMMPLFSNPSATLHDTILLEQLVDDTVSAYPQSFYGVRTLQYKYIELNNTGEKEFYDLTKDPYELKNAINDTNYTSIISQLTQTLNQLKTQ